MKYQKFFHFLQNVGKDPSAIFFEDELTRLKNRRFLLNYFKHDIDWQRSEPPVSLLLIDIDHFKRLNEQYGEEAGDQALMHISAILKDTASENAIPIRYAGDEFILLLPDTPKTEALKAAEKLLNNIHYNLFFSAEADTAIPVTLSIGIASAPDDAASGNELIHQADTALYAAKQS
ncbi:MAG: GGDEF domain-containing protein, partial [Desulfobacterales bacterium]